MGVQNFRSAKMGVFSPTFCIFGGQNFFTHFAFLVKSIFRHICRQPQNSEERNQFEYYLSLLSKAFSDTFADSRKIQRKETNSNITFLSCPLATTPLTVVYRQTKTLTTDCS